MKNCKNLYVVIIVLTLGLISCIYLLVKEKQRKSIIPETTRLLSTLTEEVYNNIDLCFDNYDFFYKRIKEDVDSFRIYSEYEPYYSSEKFKQYYRECTSFSLDADKQLFNIMNSNRNLSSEDLKFLKKLIDFVFITRMERQKLENFCLFDDVGVNIFPKKDTIEKGEEYFAYIRYAPSFYQTIPIMIVDGDTVPTIRDTQIFKEVSKKTGQIKHECMITFNWQGHIMEMPFTIEYYVK